jgi:hypothetical protein
LVPIAVFFRVFAVRFCPISVISVDQRCAFGFPMSAIPAIPESRAA